MERPETRILPLAIKNCPECCREQGTMTISWMQRPRLGIARWLRLGGIRALWLAAVGGTLSLNLSFALAQSPPCTEAEIQALVQRWRRSHYPAGSDLRACGVLAVPALVAILQDSSLSVTLQGLTVRLLVQIGPDIAVIALLEELAAAEDMAYDHILNALIVMVRHDPRLVEHANPQVRVAATYALGEQYRQTLDIALLSQTVTALLHRLDDSNEAVRNTAMYALGQIAKVIQDQVSKISQLPDPSDSEWEIDTLEIYYGLISETIGVRLASLRATWPTEEALRESEYWFFRQIALEALNEAYIGIILNPFILERLARGQDIVPGLRRTLATRPVVCRVQWLGQMVPRCRG